MARLHLACLLLTGLLTLPGAVSAADPVRTAHYVGGSVPLPDGLPRSGSPAPIACFEGTSSSSIIGCGFSGLPAGTYVLALDDETYEDVAFQWHVRPETTVSVACDFGEAVGSATVVVTAECPVITFGIRSLATTGVATVTPA